MDYQDHLKTHILGDNSCFFCRANFNRESKLTSHFLLIHRDELINHVKMLLIKC